MSHPDAATFWEAITGSGPLPALANERGEEFMRAVGREFLALAPAGVLEHRPNGRLIVAAKAM